jgi:outer membrane protein TolC
LRWNRGSLAQVNQGNSVLNSWRKSSLVARFAIVALLPLGLTGCFGGMAKRLADKEVYPIIEQRRAEAVGETAPFTIESPEDPLVDEVLTAGKAGDEFTTEGLQITLPDALALALLNSRDYQTQKENLYLVALNLTEERYEFSPMFSGTIAANLNRSASRIGNEVEPSRFGVIDTNLAVTKLFATGARVTLGLSNSFLRFYSAPPQESATGTIFAELVQPLLRGAGPTVTLENLRQAERDLIYSVRDFARFEKDFIVDRISEYYRLVQQLNVIANEEASFASLQLNLQQSRALSEAGRVSVLQVDQANQQVLIAENRVVVVKTSYLQALDDFKISLGLPTDLAVVPDPDQLEFLTEAGLEPMDLEMSEAVEVALARRYDLMTAQQEVEDAERRVKIAENALLPDLNLVANASIPDEGQNQPLSFDGRLRRYQVGAELELPLNRKVERNNFRRALITLEREARDYTLQRDLVVQEVRSLYQDLLEARRSYEIQQENVALADRTLENARMQYEAGRIQVRDVLDAEIDLRDARNNLTAALIDYSVARLRVLVAMEALDIDDRGMWKEVKGDDDVANAQP